MDIGQVRTQSIYLTRAEAVPAPDPLCTCPPRSTFLPDPQYPTFYAPSYQIQEVCNSHWQLVPVETCRSGNRGKLDNQCQGHARQHTTIKYNDQTRRLGLKFPTNLLVPNHSSLLTVIYFSPMTMRPTGAASSTGIADLDPSVRSPEGLRAVGAMPMSR